VATPTQVDALSGNGFVEVFLNRQGATDWDARWSDDAAGLSGYTPLGTVTGSADSHRFTFTNDSTHPRYLWVKDHSDSVWVAAFRPAYAAALQFTDLNGWTVPVLQSARKRIFVSSSGAGGNSGLSVVAPKTKWSGEVSGIFNPGDHILYKCGDTFTSQQQDWHPNGAGAINADEMAFTAYGDFTAGRPKFTGATDSNTPFNVGNTDNRPRLLWQHLDVTWDITARRNYFFTNNTTGQLYGIALQAQHSSGTGGAINVIVEGCHIRYASFGLVMTGNNGGSTEAARINGLTVRRTWIGDCYDYGVSGQFGNGGPQNPSGVLFHAIDNLTIQDSWFPRCAGATIEDVHSSQVASPTYAAGGVNTLFLTDASQKWVPGPTITAATGGHTTTTINFAAGTLPAVGLTNYWITFDQNTPTVALRNVQRKITGSTTAQISFAALSVAPSDNDVISCSGSPSGRMVQVNGFQRLISSNGKTTLNGQEAWNNGYGGAQPSNGTAYQISWNTPSIFRHALYIQRSCTNALIDNCYFSEGDVMLRSGGTIQNSLWAMCSIGISMEGVQRSSVDNSVLSTQAIVVQDGAQDGRREIIDGFSGGQIGYIGWDQNDGGGGGHNNNNVTFQRMLLYGDAIASEPMSYYAGGSLHILLTNTFTAAAATIVDNYVQGSNGFLDISRPANYTGLWTDRRNVTNLFSTGNGSLYLNVRDNLDWLPGGGQSTGANNIFGAAGDGHLFHYNGADQTNAAWNTKSADSGSTYPGSPLAPTAKRRLPDYCTYRGISATRAAYETQAEGQWVTNWNPIWQAKYAVDWMRAGAVNAVAAFATALVPPDAPTIGATANPTNTTLDVSWTDATSYNETGFDAGVSIDGGVTYSIVSNVGGVDAVSCTLTGLNSNTVYYIKIRAHNAAGNSDWSAPTTGTTTVIVTPPPPNLQVPGILIVGDHMTNGGSTKQVNCIDTAVSAAGASELRSSYADKIMRVVPDNPSSGAPTAAALGWYPWFDGLNGTALFGINPAGTDATHVQVTGSPGWSAGQWIGYTVTIENSFVPGYALGFSDRKVVIGNTADTLQVGSAWSVTPTANQKLFLGGNTGTAAKGAWTDYHPIAGWLTLTETQANQLSKRGGSSWGNFGAGIGLDGGLIRELLEHTYPQAPYFQVAKYFQTAPTFSAFDVATGSGKVAFAAQLAAMNTAWSALANGNALFWDLLVLDNSQRDVNDWIANPAHQASYQQKVTETIAYFRTVLGNPNLKVVIVNHAAEINNVAVPSATTFANLAHRSVAASDAIGNVRCVSMEGQPLCLDVSVLYTPSENKAFYQADVYWGPMARAVRQAYDLLLADENAADYAGAVPAYIMLGDSIFKGPITNAYLTDLASPTLTDGARDARQGIWDARTGEGVAYDVSAGNPNTSGTFSNVAGPECSMLPLLMKRAVDNSGLASALLAYTPDNYPSTPAAGGRWSKAYAENYPALKLQWQAFCRWANLSLGKQVDLKGIFVDLGTIDQTVTNGGTAFANQLAQFVADLRADFSTRTSGTPLPIIFRQPQLATASALFTEAANIRTALQKLRASDLQVFLMNVDDLERITTDSINETPDASVTDGQRIVASLTKVAI
jgi:hypothetical protein